mgnify:CR=1 FL=1
MVLVGHLHGLVELALVILLAVKVDTEERRGLTMLGMGVTLNTAVAVGAAGMEITAVPQFLVLEEEQFPTMVEMAPEVANTEITQRL